ncbi:hypothetical protein SAMN05421539_1081, partial [Jannaschia seohaensis]
MIVYLKRYAGGLGLIEHSMDQTSVYRAS